MRYPFTPIQATCPTHGDVELIAPDITAIRVVTHGGKHHDSSYYAFRCLQGGHEVCKPADEYILSLLESADVIIKRVTLPQSTFALVFEAAVTNGEVIGRLLGAGLNFFAPRRVPAEA